MVTSSQSTPTPAAAVDIRLTSGKSVREAYAGDGRDVRVGAGLQGLHHATSVLVLRAQTGLPVPGQTKKLECIWARTIRDWQGRL